MNKRPKISVVLPTYNRAQLLKRSIQSVLDQTYKDFEVIVVDDGSTDNTEEVVRRLIIKDKRVRFIKFKENKGANAARNAGIRASRGKFVAFQDSDDVWNPIKLAVQIKVLNKAPKEVGAVYCAWRVVGEKSKIMPPKRILNKSGNIHKVLLRGNFITTQVVVLKKDCFRKVGLFDENLPRYQDWEMWIRVAKYYNFKFIDKLLVIQYMQKKSISANREAQVLATGYILEKHKDDFRKDRKLMAKLYLKLSDFFDFLDPREFYRGRDYLYKAIKTRPFLPLGYLKKAGFSLFGPVIYKKISRLIRKIKRKIQL